MDLSGVEISLVGIVATGLFNIGLQTEGGVLITTESGQQITTDGGSGYQEGSFAAGPGGTMMTVRRGWPDGSQLTRDLSTGMAYVTIFADRGMARNTTRYLDRDRSVVVPGTQTASTLLLRSNGVHMTVNGTPAVGQVCGVLLGGIGYVYQVQSGDTCQSIASSLAGLTGASASGAVVTFPTQSFSPRVGMNALSGTEARRQDQMIRISCWCPTPQVRDTVASAVDLAMSPDRYVNTSDGWSLFIRYAGTHVDDMSSKAGILRRDMVYAVEYPTTITTTAPVMLFGDLHLNGIISYN